MFIFRIKIIYIFALFGFLFSFLIGIVNKVNILHILIRSIISGFFLFFISIILIYFFKMSLSEEDFNSLFNINSNPANDNKSIENTETREENIDLKNEDDIKYEDIINNNIKVNESEFKSYDSFVPNLSIDKTSTIEGLKSKQSTNERATVTASHGEIEIKSGERTIKVEPQMVAKAINTMIKRDS